VPHNVRARGARFMPQNYEFRVMTRCCRRCTAPSVFVMQANKQQYAKAVADPYRCVRHGILYLCVIDEWLTTSHAIGR